MAVKLKRVWEKIKQSEEVLMKQAQNEWSESGRQSQGVINQEVIREYLQRDIGNGRFSFSVATNVFMTWTFLLFLIVKELNHGSHPDVRDIRVCPARDQRDYGISRITVNI